MANSRPASLILPSGVPDEINTNNISTIHGRSSTSSIDSTSGKNINFNEKNSLTHNALTTTASSTTTDSDFESDQDDNLPLQQQKNDLHTSEHSSRRVRHFQKLFKSEIPDDMPDLIDSYVCAYQGDILLQGKMYITDRYLCFHSRIIKYVTKHVYRWEQIENVRKERVAFIFPTAICIQLKQSGKKIVYASFLQRDQAYEKIVSIWSKCINDNHSYNDNDNDLPQDGTLKPNNHHDKSKYLNRETYDNNIDESGQDVLQMCLKPNQRRSSFSARKSYDDKQLTKKSSNSYEKKNSLKNSSQDQKSSINQTTRRSHYTKHEQKVNDTTKRNSSRKNHRSPSTSRQNGSHDQTDEILSNSNPSSTVISNTNSSITTTDLNGTFIKILNTILSFLSQIRTYVSLSYPIKTLIIILLILTMLFFHSFYLIKVAYRIENRLQSLHQQWPSSMKSSVSSNIK